MASFGASGLANDWLSGGGLQDAVSMGQPAGVSPRPQTFSWDNWSPITPVHGIDDMRGATTYKLDASMNAYRATHPDSRTAPASSGPTGGTATMGGDWSGVEQWQSSINSAAAATGLDPDQIKAIMKLESNGDPNAAGAAGVWGPMQVNSNAWGDGPWMSDPNANILKGAQILKQNMDEHGGSFYEGLRAYHGYGTDGYTTDTQYADIVMGNYNTLKAGTASSTGAGFATGMPSTSAAGAVGPDNPAGLSVLNTALSYVGKIPYIWGAIPGKGQDPAQTGWDCSGFTYWLDQNYGTGQLKMGSHYQYQQAVDNGTLFTNTSQLQAGDLIFIDTGWMEGAGSEQNRAGHVAVYLGNGKILHAVNPDQGTVVSDLAGFADGSFGKILGAEHMSWSGGAPGGFGGGGGATAAPLTGFDQWRQTHVGGSVGTTAPASNGLIDQWRWRNVGS